MKTYFALVHKDADSAFGVTFPDISGCYSAADSLDDIVPKAAEALALWFEDAAPVQPRSLEAITAEVADDLAGGAFLVAVPWIPVGGRSVRVNLSMDSYMVDAIDQAAKARGLTRSAFVAEAARHMIEARA